MTLKQKYMRSSSTISIILLFVTFTVGLIFNETSENPKKEIRSIERLADKNLDIDKPSNNTEIPKSFEHNKSGQRRYSKTRLNIPSMPRNIAIIDRPNEERLIELREAAVLGRELSNIVGKYWREGKARHAETHILTLFKAYEKNELEALVKLSELRSLCHWLMGADDMKPLCAIWDELREKRKRIGEPFNILARLEALALAGNLQAQYHYHFVLLEAVESKEMMPAIDGELWLDRRQRMIHYLYQFSLVGDYYSSLIISNVYGDDLIIEESPFWSAVFYKQFVESFNSNDSSDHYDRFLEERQLDRESVDFAWMSIYQ